MTNTGRLIADHRISLNITQKELGKKLGDSSGQFTSNLERGKAGLPLKRAKKVCRILCIKEKDLKQAIIADFVSRVSKTLK